MLNPEQKPTISQAFVGRVSHRGMDANEEVQDCPSGRLPKCGAWEGRLVGAPRPSGHHRISGPLADPDDVIQINRTGPSLEITL
jgi:hypothetical protein